MGVISAQAGQDATTKVPLVPRSGGRGRILAILRATALGFGRLPLKAKVGVVILGAFVLIAIIGPWLAPYDPSATTTQAIPIGPTSQHLLGTDSTGRDILSQMLIGTRSTVVLALLTGLIATLLSVAVGTAAGYLAGYSDEVLSLV